MSKTVKAAEFKQTCLALMDEVAESRESILITKRGKIVAKLAPASTSRPPSLGCLKHEIEILDEDFSLPAWNVNEKKGRA